MTLYMIGLGLFGKKDISIRGFETISQCDVVYLEHYTSKISASIEELEKFYGKKIILASRDLVEKKPEETILKDSVSREVAFLVPGDPMSATTHIDLKMRAQKQGINVVVINAASVFSAIAITGLQLYKFGPTTSIPFPEETWVPETPYNIIKENLERGLHTLVLLDLRPDENRYMTVSQAINYLLKIEAKRKENVFTADTLCIGCARLGSQDQAVKCGNASEIAEYDFGDPMHCLVVPGKLHFAEEHALKSFAKH